MDAQLEVRQLEFGSVALPSSMVETTWYEFNDTSHPIKSLTFDRTDVESKLLLGWIQAQRQRAAARGAFASESERYENPRLYCEGFWIAGSDQAPPEERLHIVGIAAEFEVRMLMATLLDHGANLFRALVERIVPNGATRDPAGDWRWRKAYDLWFPVPMSSERPSSFTFEDEADWFNIEFKPPPVDPDTLWSSNKSHSDWQLSNTSFGARSQTARAVLGESTLARSVVWSPKAGAVLAGRAPTKSAAALLDQWDDIVRSVSLEEPT